MTNSSVKHFTGEKVWTPADFTKHDEWIHTLSDAALADIDKAVTTVRNRGRDLDTLTPADFNLPALTEDLLEISQVLNSGRGFVLIKGLAKAGYSEEELGHAFWGIGTHIGTGVSQSYRGDRLGHVRDMGETDRYYTAGGELEMHMDPVDVAGLLCVQPAESGGVSRIASSANVHNIILKERPDLIDALYHGLIYSRRQSDLGEDQPASTYRIPVFTRLQGMPVCHFLPISVRLAAKHHGIEMTETEREVLALVGEIAQRSDVCMEMDFQHGDIQFLNNRVILHSRSDYTDPKDARLKRHLLRLWLMVDAWIPLPPHMRMQGPADRAGGGIAKVS
ncbi:MAG: TauD/TfdA family dioxygenase [Pseudomonadota bacterium]|nr:TauD/TfdA family dioxygenase [Pseudomonadota bacterium]